MILGSHNSLSFCKPVWYMIPFRFLAQCQNKTISEQYDLGVKMFDFRLKKSNNKWYIAHGIMKFCDISKLRQTLSYLDTLQDKIYVRFVLEYNSAPKNAESLTNEFTDLVEGLMDVYSNLHLTEVRTKWDWKALYKDSKFTMEDCYSSVKGNNFISKLLIKTWAKKHNKEVLEKGTKKKCLMIDYVGLS